MGRASARTPVSNAVYVTARASASCEGLLASILRLWRRRLSSAETAVQRGDPTGARSSVLRRIIHWAGKISALSAGFPVSQIIDLTRFQVSEDPGSYTKTFFVFSARNDFFENPSSHYSWKFNGHVEHMKISGIVRGIHFAYRLGAQTPPSLCLAPPKARKVPD